MGILSFFGFGKTVPAVTPLGKRDEFLVGFASVLCAIDGEVAKEEGEALEAASRALEPAVHKRLADLTANRGKFLLLQQWCRGIGLHEHDRAWIGEKLIGYADVDRQRTSEENAFLVQAAQILEGNEQLPLFIGASAIPEVAATHDLFDYLTEAQFRERFPASACDFKDRQLYTLHPYLSESLMRFSVEDFEDAQSEVYDGFLDVLRELGAKRVIISRSKDEVERYKHKGSVEASGATTGSLKVDGSVSGERLIKEKETIEARFDGRGLPLFSRIFPWPLRRRLLRKYRANPHYVAVIQNRFGHNKLKYLEYKLQSRSASKVAASFSASLKLKMYAASGGASGGYSRESVEAVEKYFLAEFH